MELSLILALVAATGIGLYVLADGFDLGVGILFLIAPRERDRDVMVQSVAPLWDGNEAWLVFGGALLWASCPGAYSVLLPAFYLPLVTMLFAWVLRAIAFEFRFRAKLMRRLWDFAFAGGSLLVAIAQGLVLGGLIGGVPVQTGIVAGGPFSCFTILGLLCAAGLVGGYGLLGAGWLIWRTDGPAQVFGREVGHAALILTVASMTLASIWTELTVPDMTDRWFAWPTILPLAILALAAAIVAWLIWRALWEPDRMRPFLLTIVLFLLGFAGLAVSLSPYVVPRTTSDGSTLRLVGVGLAVFVPIILAYLGLAYSVFRGKTMEFGDEADPQPDRHAGRRASALESNLHLS